MARSLFSAHLLRGSLLVGGCALPFIVGACEKLVGIEDTNVTAPADGAGASSTDHAGASNAGESDAGATQGGKVEAGGSANGGKSGKAGSANDGGAGAGGEAAGGKAGANSAGSGGGTAQCDCKSPTPVCVNGVCVARGPVQMQAGSKAGNTSFYIDSTEVTNEQYAAFLAAKGNDTSGQRAECAWNKSYQPADAIGDDKRPAVNVDFCDAAAFCDWAGERLCGDLSGGPLAITNPNLTDPAKSQWYLACAGPDKTEYPYGNDKKADYCNEYSSGDMANAGEFTKCEGHYPGVFDLVGNAAEWIDSCVDDPGGDHSLDTCALMGGSYLRDDFDCSSQFTQPRNDTAGVFGFRCCSK